jgi:hypothetical protein
MTEDFGDGPQERKTNPITVRFANPASHGDSFDIRSIFLDARNRCTLQSREKDVKGWRKYFSKRQLEDTSLPMLVDTEALDARICGEQDLPEAHPRTLLATIPNRGAMIGFTERSVGYVIFSRPYLEEGNPHVSVQDLSIRQEMRSNPQALRSLVEAMLHFRVDGQRLTYDAKATEAMHRGLSRPGIQNLIRGRGYEVQFTGEPETRDNEQFYPMSLVPITNS